MKLKTRLKFKSSKTLIFVFVALLVGVGIGYSIGHTDKTPYIEQAAVAFVIDGDTIELVDGRHVRYLGVDTPEAGEPFADEATAMNKELVQGKMVDLQRGKRDKDEYGRLLRYVYVDGVFVNAELVVQGYATAYIFDPDEKYSQVIVQLEQYAKLQERGLWAINKGGH